MQAAHAFAITPQILLANSISRRVLFVGQLSSLRKSRETIHTLEANTVKSRKPLLSLALTLLCLCIVSGAANAQVSSATITGAVKDPSGSVIPKAKVVATHISTGVSITVITNGAGEYTLPLLPAGTYKIVVSAKGFKTYEVPRLALSVGDHPTIDVPLALGEASQTVTVTAEDPLLGTEDSNLGQVVSQQVVDTLPLSGRTPMSFVQYTVGVTATANPVSVHPFDNSAVAAFSVGGLPNKNAEILLDGSPDNASDNAPAYELPLEATQEITIKIFESDATYGHSGGAVANQITKSGTNKFHGALYEFNQNNDLAASNFFSKRQGVGPTVSRYNQFGGTIGGPVWIPKVFNGRDKMFFFFSYEGIEDSQRQTINTTVPTDPERRGDFSALIAPGNNGVPNQSNIECGKGTLQNPYVYSKPYNSNVLFDPATGTLNAACLAQGFFVYERQPFANNILTTGSIPLNPVALATLKYFPEPTNPNAYLGYLNYQTAYRSGDHYNNEIGRLDYTLRNQRIYLTGRHNYRNNFLNQVFGQADPAIGDDDFRINFGGSVGDIVTFTPSLLGEFRLNYTRYSQPTYLNGEGFNPSTLGLPNLPSAHYQFPQIYFSDYGTANGTQQSLGTTSQQPGTAPFDSYDLFTDFIKTEGLHTLKWGLDVRKFQKGNFTFGNSGGLYNFDNGFTASFGGDPLANYQADFAAFMLGLPSSASYDFNTHSIGNQAYMALFVQDDWRVKPNLTLNVGLRMDKDFSPSEREGTAVNGFNTTGVNPYSAAATAAYAAHPNSTLAVGDFKVLGGLTFNSPGITQYSHFPSLDFSPRFGLSYSPHFLGGVTKDVVVRAGFGIFVLPIFPFNNSINQSGFSQTTQSPIVPFAPPTAGGPGTLSNPFPNGLTPPSGSSLGLATFAGQNITFLDPYIKNGYSERWHLGLQKQFAHSWMADVFYEGSTGRRLPITENLNYVKRQYETTASNTALSASVANPFYGLIPNGGTLNSRPTVPLTTLLQTYPEFGSVTEQNVPAGGSIFHSLDMHVEHRMGYGLSFFANYQWSKTIEAVTFLNNSDPKPERRISQYDHPTHAVVVLSDQIPFGRGRQFGSNIPRWLDEPIGGWVIASSWYYQQGAPITWGNIIPIPGVSLNYNPRQATENGGGYATCPAFNVNAFQNGTSTLPGSNCGNPNTTGNLATANNIRVFGSQYAAYRADAWNDWDASLQKNFNILEGSYFQLRLDAFNVNNRPVFGTPNLTPASGSFGQILSQNNSSRFLQVGGKLVF
jgi:hypothetical protein